MTLGGNANNNNNEDYDTYEDENLLLQPPYLFKVANKYTCDDINSTEKYGCPIWVGRYREARIELCGAYYIHYNIVKKTATSPGIEPQNTT